MTTSLALMSPPRYNKDVPTLDINFALSFMADAMKHLTRRGGGPASQHPARVSLAISEAGLRREVIVAAALHDLLEDTPVTPERIEDLFGLEVLRLVQAVSYNPRMQKGKKRDNDMLARAELHGPEAVAIKIADNTDNITTLEHFAPHKREHYVRYAKKINAMGKRVLGADNTLVQKHTANLHRAIYSLS